MNRKSLMLTSLASLMGSFGGTQIPIKNDYNQRSIRVLSYKKGGKPFTRGRKTASLRSRSNRLKAKAKS